MSDPQIVCYRLHKPFSAATFSLSYSRSVDWQVFMAVIIMGEQQVIIKGWVNSVQRRDDFP